jgi:hypothetical protein
METVNLVKFLSEEAAALVRSARAVGIADGGKRLDEAAELLTLAANMMARNAVVEDEVRRAA